jgi:hypothetical protein
MITDLHDIKMKKRYYDKGKHPDGTFNDLREQFLKTAHQRSHMKKITRHDKEILSKQIRLGTSQEARDPRCRRKILSKQTKLINTIEEKE